MSESNKNVTRSDIADAICESVQGLTAKDSSRVVDSVLLGIRESLVKGVEVKISGFGKFVILEKAPRKGRNPKTGEEIMISARRVTKFRPSEVLREELNENPFQ